MGPRSSMGSPMTLMMRPSSLSERKESHNRISLTEELGADGDLNRAAGISNGLAADKTLGTVHGNGTDGVLTEMLGNFEDKAGVAALDLKSVKNVGQLCGLVDISGMVTSKLTARTALELNVDDGSDDGDNLALGGTLLGVHGVLAESSQGGSA